MYSIMIVEDDVNIGNMLQEALELEKYKVTRAYSGTEALMLLEKEKPDLVLLDLMLPGLSGEEILPRLGGALTIVMSAKTDIDSKLKMLYEGASDYVTKPFVLSEMLARIAALLRLSATKGNESKEPAVEEAEESSITRVGNMSLNTELMTVTIDGNETSLTRTETAILNILMMNPNRPMGRSTILDRISEDTPDCTERSLKQHVSNIRKKLEALDGIDHIEAIYGIGFKFNEE